MSRLAGGRFLKPSYSWEASSLFILYCMSHLLATIYRSATVCCNLRDTQWQCYERPFRDEWCSLSLPRSLLLYLSLPSSHSSLVSFELGRSCWKGSRSNQRVGAWIGGIRVGSALTRCFLRQSVIQRPPVQALLTTTQSRAQCQAMDYLTEWAVWRLFSPSRKPDHMLASCPQLLVLFWFERGQNPRCFRAARLSSGCRPRQWASTVCIGKKQ